jgi:transposase
LIAGGVVTGQSKTPRGPSKYSEATRGRAVRLVLEHTARFGSEAQCVRHVAEQCGVSAGTLTRWVREARAEAGEAEPLMDWKDRRIAELEREKAELELTVEVLKAATTFFVRECDPRPASSASS